MKEHFSVISSIRPGAFVIYDAGNKPLVTIKPDGSIEYGEGYNPDEAAKTFWAAMGRHRPKDQ